MYSFIYLLINLFNMYIYIYTYTHVNIYVCVYYLDVQYIYIYVDRYPNDDNSSHHFLLGFIHRCQGTEERGETKFFESPPGDAQAAATCGAGAHVGFRGVLSGQSY